jgi:hypothetical protein
MLNSVVTCQGSIDALEQPLLHVDDLHIFQTPILKHRFFLPRLPLGHKNESLAPFRHQICLIRTEVTLTFYIGMLGDRGWFFPYTVWYENM